MPLPEVTRHDRIGEIERVVSERDRGLRHESPLAVAFENRYAVSGLIDDSQVEHSIASEVTGCDRHRVARLVSKWDRRECLKPAATVAHEHCDIVGVGLATARSITPLPKSPATIDDGYVPAG